MDKLTLQVALASGLRQKSPLLTEKPQFGSEMAWSGAGGLTRPSSFEHEFHYSGTEAQAGHGTRPEPLDEHVGLLEELPHDRGPRVGRLSPTRAGGLSRRIARVVNA